MKTIKYLFLLLIFIPIFSFSQNLSKEEKAIMKVIAKETRAYFERDLEAWKATYVQTDYFRQHSYWEGWPTPVKSVQGWEAKLASSQNRFDPERPKDVWDGSKYEKENLNIRISKSGDMAWVTFTETAIHSQTKERVGEAIGTRVMEKHDGQWKIAYLGYHYFPKANQ